MTSIMKNSLEVKMAKLKNTRKFRSEAENHLKQVYSIIKKPGNAESVINNSSNNNNNK
jgi:hypothetical protein